MSSTVSSSEHRLSLQEKMALVMQNVLLEVSSRGSQRGIKTGKKKQEPPCQEPGCTAGRFLGFRRGGEEPQACSNPQSSQPPMALPAPCPERGDTPHSCLSPGSGHLTPAAGPRLALQASSFPPASDGFLIALLPLSPRASSSPCS